MSKAYRIHLGFSRSRRYPQAVELSKLPCVGIPANAGSVGGLGDDVCYRVSLPCRPDAGSLSGEFFVAWVDNHFQ